MLPEHMFLESEEQATPLSRMATPSKEHCATTPDPLGDVIDWLGHADIDDELVREESDAATSCTAGSPSSPGGAAREPFAKTPPPVAQGGSPVGEPGLDRAATAPSGGDTAEPPVFTGRLNPAGGSQRSLTGYCGLGGKESDARGALEPEEEEWDARQQQTGAAGRLVIYDEGDRPRSDFLLRGGAGRRIMVTAVTDGGKAAQAGVKAGDVLVSIDGKKDFKEKPADHVHASLKGPVMLVFMGFVGKLQAEVRLNYKQKVCGLSSQHQVVFGRPDAPVQVVDEVIFHPGTATLLLATSPPEPRPVTTSRSLSRGKGGSGLAGDDGHVGEEPEGSEMEETGAPGSCIRTTESAAESLSAVYELRGPEARSLVSRALSRARTASPFVPRYAASGGNFMEDVAQVPRSITPSSSPLANRIDGKFGKPSDVALKPFHFSTDGSQMDSVLGTREGDRSNCDASSWWGGTACPRSHQ